jgi:flagellin
MQRYKGFIMGFRINTNVSALNAHTNAQMTNRALASSLEKLSSGLRINKAADDASGMSIADSLRSQASSLGQAISNANDAIGIIQIADKAMDEQVKILDTIKTKATQAAQDGQTADSRKALQADIVRLMEELDNIAGTTSYNGQNLLSGQFTNKEFQIGAYSNQSIKASIGATSSDKIGNTRFETGAVITASGTITLTFKNADGRNDIKLESVVISSGAQTGIGVLAEVINKNSDKTGVKASWQVVDTGSSAIQAGSISGLTINGITIGTVNGIKANDSDGKLVAAINAVKDQTGVEAYIDNEGKLNLRSLDGRGIEISGAGLTSVVGLGTNNISKNFGRLTLTRLDARDIQISASGTSGGTAISGNTTGVGFSAAAQATINLRTIRGEFSVNQASAIGMWANGNVTNYGKKPNGGVVTLRGAMAVIDIAESAQKMLDKIRGDLGSVQNQLVSTVNNISVTQVNVKAAESQIRDVDFAAESANFSKLNILAQSGSYALSQANAVQQNVLKLLQ